MRTRGKGERNVSDSMTPWGPSPDELLQAVYRDLDLETGDLCDAVDRPLPSNPAADRWVDNGEWLSLAHSLGVERVFFVANNPVFVFARRTKDDPEELRRFFNRVWCMARPRLLFLAEQGRLCVYDLRKAPPKPDEAVDDGDRLLKVVSSVAEVQSQLRDYHRSLIETGRVPGDELFEGASDRADEALIRDLRSVRSALVKAGLKVEHTHALIGRSIFVRYLEDREILDPDYFMAVAREDPRWQELIKAPAVTPDVDPAMEHLLYPRVLSDKRFTYALFAKLGLDFNGDMFPADPEEDQAVSQEHLNLLQQFLRGVVGPQGVLFFYAYRFDVIPIELISSIYEEFYNTEVKDKQTGNQGSHYTPSTLVEFVCSQVLTNERLSQRPRVLDPACGSGIFLVEAFRRIVRHRTFEQGGERPNRHQLREILRSQVAGIEINAEAVRVAAFSLYVAFLHYQHPRSIRQYKKLPHLIYQTRAPRQDEEYFDVLFHANAFDLSGALFETGEIEAMPRLASGAFDIVVGNPPWGSPKKNDLAGKASAKLALAWCERRSLSVGDDELSQAFIHRTMDFLKDGGEAGLLVSTGVFFKTHDYSRLFRRQWLGAATLRCVVNFAHVRDIFFRGAGRSTEAVSPFASVTFKKGHTPGSFVEYWAAKKSAFAYAFRAVSLSQPDLHVVPQDDLASDDELWKVYWWGGHRDRALISALRREAPLSAVKKRDGTVLVTSIGRGFEEANGQSPSDRLSPLEEMPTKSFERYGPLPYEKFRPIPSHLWRFGNMSLYSGDRVLVKRGISQGKGVNGRIEARYESAPFAFRHSIYGFRMSDYSEREAKILLGIIWSSLSRYYHWMTVGSWGMWHHEILDDDWRCFPVKLYRNEEVESRLVSIVDRLRDNPDGIGGLFSADEKEELERELDECVFDLYLLNDAERDLVNDMCKVGLDLFYRGINGEATRAVSYSGLRGISGVARDLPEATQEYASLSRYLRAFLQAWNVQAGDGAEFAWEVIPAETRTAKAAAPVLAVVFTLIRRDSAAEPLRPDQRRRFTELLRDMDADLLVPSGSKSIYLDGLVRIVRETQLIVIKRNEVRLWTASAAREDAEALMLQAIKRQEALRSTDDGPTEHSRSSTLGDTRTDGSRHR
jgi:hypothetical protein